MSVRLNYLIGNPDASEWATQFTSVVDDLGLVGDEDARAELEELALTWFMNAIETGRMACEGSSARNNWVTREELAVAQRTIAQLRAASARQTLETARLTRLNR